MRPVRVRDENADFAPPPDWNESEDGRCANLPIRREQIGSRTYHYSNWKPDAEELVRLIAGGVVELCCVGLQPPVAVSVVTGTIISETPTKDRDLEALKQTAMKKAS